MRESVKLARARTHYAGKRLLHGATYLMVVLYAKNAHPDV